MAELTEFRQRLDVAVQRIESGVPGDTRRSIESAVRQIRSVLEHASIEFLRGNGHPPPDLTIIKNLIHLVKHEFNPDRRLARKVAKTINEVSSRGSGSAENLSPPPVDLVRTWMEIAYSWLDALEPILMRRRQRAENVQQ